MISEMKRINARELGWVWGLQTPEGLYSGFLRRELEGP